MRNTMGKTLILFVLSIISVAVGLFCFASAYPQGSEENPLQVFCGAASKPPMEECAAAFEKKTNIKVEVQFGGSGAMLSALKMSKRGDIFIPGAPDYMVKAEREGVVDPKKVKILAYLVPAILVQKGNPKGIRSLEDLARRGITVGIGNPEAVCVGLYAVEVLNYSGLLEKVGKNIIVHAESCEKTAALIAMKKVDAILGWREFSKWNPEAIEAVLIAPDKIPRLAYIPAGVCTTSKDPERAWRFIEFLASLDGQRIFAKWGYIISEEEVRKFAPKAKIGGEYMLPANYKPPVR